MPMPSERATTGVAMSRSRPSTTTAPPSGRCEPATHLTSVLLPAPFSPRRACTDPGATFIVTLSIAVKAPNRLVSSKVSSASAPVGGGMGSSGAVMACAELALSAGSGSAVSGERFEHRARRGHGAEHAALHRHHLQRGEVIAAVGRGGAVREDQALEAAVV